MANCGFRVCADVLPMTRYALYFAPPPGTACHDAGSTWLGRDAENDAQRLQPPIDGMPPSVLAALTTSARRYGFHATLKAPFRLVAGCEEADLLAMARRFCSTQHPVPLHDLAVHRQDDFLALCPAMHDAEVNALAMRCVGEFDTLRAAPHADELTRRRHAGLGTRGEELLLRWGYPYVDEAYRFHMTLTDSLAAVDTATVAALERAATVHFQPALTAGPMAIEALCVVKEDAPGAPLSIIARYGFQAEASSHRPGRLGDGSVAPGASVKQ